VFDQVFSDLHSKIPEIRMVGVWGTDGLELEKYVFAPLEVDVDFLGAEVADIITKINGIQPATESVKVKLVMDDGWLYVFRLTREFFLIVLTERSVLNGRVTFYADIYGPRLKEIL